MIFSPFAMKPNSFHYFGAATKCHLFMRRITSTVKSKAHAVPIDEVGTECNLLCINSLKHLTADATDVAPNANLPLWQFYEQPSGRRLDSYLAGLPAATCSRFPMAAVGADNACWLVPAFGVRRR
jgi:hypothetical protein